MDLDKDELKVTRKRNGFKKESLSKEQISKIIRNRIYEIDNEEWYENDPKKCKFYCQEELESILFRMLKEEE